MFDAPTPLLLPFHQESQNIPTIAYDYPSRVTLEALAGNPIERTQSKRVRLRTCAIALYCVFQGLPRLPYMLALCVSPRAIVEVLCRSSSICSGRGLRNNQYYVKYRGLKRSGIVPTRWLSGFCQIPARYLTNCHGRVWLSFSNAYLLMPD